MSTSAEKFERYRWELARLNEPVARRSAPLLSPVEVKVVTQPAAAADPSDATPRITVEPQSLSCHLSLFRDTFFEFDAGGRESAEVFWRTRAEETWQRAPMERQPGGPFNATLSIEDGDYFYGFKAEGVTLPDPRRAHRLLISADGAFSMLRLSRHEQLFKLHNRGAATELVQVESNAAWLEVSGKLKLAPGESAMIRARLLPSRMFPGLNEAVVSAFAVSGDGARVCAGTAHVSAELEAGGAVAEFRHYPREFGWVMQGGESLRLLVEVRAKGRGPLGGMVTLAQPREDVDFQLDAGGAEMLFSHTFVVGTDKLSRRSEGHLQLMLITDTYLANRRVSVVKIPYKLVYLQKSLPALTFGKIPLGFAKVLRLEVTRSDGEDVALEVDVPAGVARNLEVFPARANVYVFRLNTHGLEAGTRVNEVITLTDSRSGLRDHITAVGEVVSYRPEGFGDKDLELSRP